MIVQAPQGPDASDAEGVSVVLDAWGGLHEVCGASDGALLLVRPDGYVAFHRHDNDNDVAVLQQHLFQVLRSEGRP